MIGRLDLDEEEEKKCGAYQYGKKFKSFRIGYRAGKTDGRKTTEIDFKKCPYKIPSELYELLKKRARWQAGYDLGWQTGSNQKKAKKQKKKRQDDDSE